VAPVAAPAAVLPDDKLPPLEQLVAQVPAPLRDLLDDLFRAKFTGVRRIAASETEAQAKTRR
jgi:hypothetical protein